MGIALVAVMLVLCLCGSPGSVNLFFLSCRVFCLGISKIITGRESVDFVFDVEFV